MARLNHKAHSYDPANAEFLARVSELAYEPDHQKVIRKAFGWGFKPTFIEREDTQVLILESEHAGIIAPRGTEIDRERPREKLGLIRRLIHFVIRLFCLWRFKIDIDKIDLSDVVTDIDIRKRPGPLAGKVHKGFLDAYQLVWDRDILPAIESMKRRRGSSFPIYLTGHSLGAALATLMTAGCLENAIEPSGVYLFGAPRVGDWRFCKALDQLIGTRAFRIVNNNDIVTRIPPAFLFGYRHVGQFIYITSDGQVIHGPDSGFVRRDRIKGRIDDLGELGTDGAKDHFARNYREMLRRE